MCASQTFPEGFDFPFASQVVLVYRERADLDDVMKSSKTSYYLTSVSNERGDPERLGRHRESSLRHRKQGPLGAGLEL